VITVEHAVGVNDTVFLLALWNAKLNEVLNFTVKHNECCVLYCECIQDFQISLLNLVGEIHISKIGG
jgi:hypothetical protein